MNLTHSLHVGGVVVKDGKARARSRRAPVDSLASGSSQLRTEYRLLEWLCIQSEGRVEELTQVNDCRVMPHEPAWEGDSFFLRGGPGGKGYIVRNY